MAVIKSVCKSSPFYGKIRQGDVLISVNGRRINDVLDYMFVAPDTYTDIKLCVCRDGEELCFTEKCGHDFGFEFDSFLMDKQKSCKNKCVFCFIDQMPPNMRDTLYFKDDDFRLSLIYGNYVTFTNATEQDLDRICELHISPLNVSVHATDGDVRVKMLKNPNAKNIMSVLTRLASAGINLRCQIVLCPGINDGEVLKKSLRDLSELYPAVSSVSVVPVGVTRFRQGLPELVPFTKQTAKDALAIINAAGDRCFAKHGSRIIFGADEFYLKAEEPVPDVGFYEDLEQYEDGIGMIASFTDDIEYLTGELQNTKAEKTISLVTGVAATETIDAAMKKICGSYPGLKYNLYTVINNYFGTSITVAGLMTGTDIISQLRGKALGDYLIVPDVCLRDNTFLDGVTVSDAEKALGVEICVAETGAEGLIDAVDTCVNQ